MQPLTLQDWLELLMLVLRWLADHEIKAQSTSDKRIPP